MPLQRRLAVIALLIVEASFVLWGAMAAIAPERLLGPGGLAILPAGYQGFTGGSWTALVEAAPRTAGYMTLLYRTYGAYNVAFGILGLAIAAFPFRRGEVWAWWTLLVGNVVTLGAATTYDRLARAIGPFELSEYLGLALVFAALAITAPARGPELVRRPVGRREVR